MLRLTSLWRNVSPLKSLAINPVLDHSLHTGNSDTQLESYSPNAAVQKSGIPTHKVLKNCPNNPIRWLEDHSDHNNAWW